MATPMQITYLEGQVAIATQVVREYSRLTGASVRAYGGRKVLDGDICRWQGQRTAYQDLLRLAKAGKF